MADFNLFEWGPEGRGLYVDASGSLHVNSSPTASGFIVGYGQEGHPLLVDASGRLHVTGIDGGSGGAATLDDLDDVSTSGLLPGYSLVYNGSGWVPSGVTASGSSTTLNALTDTNLSGLTTGDVLTLSGSLWVPSGITHPADLVTSVNGQSGVVSITATDLGALTSASGIEDLFNVDTSGAIETSVLALSGSTWIPSGITHPPDSVLSVNGQSGVVIVSASGLGALTSASGIGDLNDVNVSGLVIENVLSWNGAEWIPSGISHPSAPVLAVNGQTGTVSLSIDDLSDATTTGALEANVLALSGSTWIPSGIVFPIQSPAPVTSVNSQSGVVVISATELGALTSSSGINDLVDVSTSGASPDEVLTWNGSSWVASGVSHPTAPVTSVNSLSGVVTITATDLGALTSASGVEDLSNVDTSGAQETDVLALSGSTWVPSGVTHPQDAVTSVNGQSGVVSITATDLGALTSLSGISDLSDANGSGAVAEDSLVWDGSEWVPSGIIHPEVATLSGLTDTLIAAPASGELLSYDGSKWVNLTNTVASSGMYAWKLISTSGVNTSLGYIQIDGIDLLGAKEVRIIANDLDASADSNWTIRCGDTSGVMASGAADYSYNGWTNGHADISDSQHDLIQMMHTSADIDDTADGLLSLEIGLVNANNGTDPLSIRYAIQGVHTATALMVGAHGEGFFNGGLQVGSIRIDSGAATLNSGTVEVLALVKQNSVVQLPTTLDNLFDVNTAGVNEGDTIVLSGSTWVASGVTHPVNAIDDLSDVETSGLLEGTSLVYDGSTWVPSGVTASGASTTLDALTDTDLSGSTETSVLTLSGSTWVPSGISHPAAIPAPVDSVNGQSGVVSLAADDLSNVNETGATETDVLALSGSTWVPSGITHPASVPAPVDSVNGQSGVVSLAADDLSNVNETGATETDVLALSGSTWVPSGITHPASVPAPVTSVNGLSGVVSITATDLGALTSSSGISDLSDVNTSGATEAQVLALSGSTWVPSGVTHPADLVTSVNGQSGVVSLGADDIIDIDTSGLAVGYSLVWDGSNWSPSGVTAAPAPQPSGSGSTIQNVFGPTYHDDVRGVEVSVETATYSFSEANINDLEWIQLGVASDADSGYAMPYSGIVVSSAMQCENTGGTTKGIDLYVNANSSGTIASFSGVTENQTVFNEFLNIGFNQGDKIRLRGGAGGGNITDTNIQIRIKWLGHPLS